MLVNLSMTYWTHATDFEKNIVATLAWFDLFQYPLTLEEIAYFLIKKFGEEDQNEVVEKNSSEFREAFLSKILKTIQTIPCIEIHHGMYYLSGRSDNLQIRQEREKVSRDLWKKVNRWIPWFRLVPFIRMVAVCNTLAFNNAHTQSDIDLLIITEKNRLSTARILSTILFHLLGIRRHGNKRTARFCLSFYLSEEGMDLRNIKEKNDPYLIYWLRTVHPVFGGETVKTFFDQNAWNQENFYLGQNDPIEIQNLSKSKAKEPCIFKALRQVQSWILKGVLGDFVERKLLKIQQKRHHKKLPSLGAEASIIISQNILKFHNIDRRREYAKQFEEQLTRIFQK